MHLDDKCVCGSKIMKYCFEKTFRIIDGTILYSCTIITTCVPPRDRVNGLSRGWGHFYALIL